MNINKCLNKSWKGTKQNYSFLNMFFKFFIITSMTGKGETQGGKRIGRFALRIDKRGRIYSIGRKNTILEEKIIRKKVIGYSHIDRVTAQKMRMAAKKL